MAGLPRASSDDMTPDQAAQIVGLYGGSEGGNDEPLDGSGADLSPLASARGDEMGDDSATDNEAVPTGGLPNVDTMFAKNPRVQAADAKLDNIIAEMTTRQQMLMAQHQQNGTALPLLSFASGMLSPTRTGGFSESLGAGIKSALPAIQQENEQSRADQQGIFGLRLKAAQLEQDRAKMEASRVYQENSRQQKRKDEFAKMGLKLQDDGTPVVDPEMLNAVTAKGRKLIEARASAHNSMINNANPNLGEALTEEEITGLGLPPGTVAVHGKQGPRILSKPANMVLTGFDEDRNPIYSDKQTMVPPKLRSDIEKDLTTTKNLLGHYNWLIDQIESGKVNSTAFGPQGAAGAAASKVGGWVSDTPIAPEDTNFRTALGLTIEPTKNALSRVPGMNMSNKEAADIEPFLPNVGVMSSATDALTKLKAVRSRLIATAKNKAQMLGSQDHYSDQIPEWEKTIQKADNFDSGPLFGPTGKVSKDTSSTSPHTTIKSTDFTPIKVTKGGKTATVSSKAELDEAKAEGWQ